MEIDARKIIEITSKLNNLLEGFDTFFSNKKNNLTIKDKLLIFLLEKDLAPFELIKCLGIAKTNLALIVKDLSNNGDIEKFHDEIDKRNITISLTEKGKTKAEEILNNLNKNINQILAFKNNAEKINSLLDELNKEII